MLRPTQKKQVNKVRIKYRRLFILALLLSFFVAVSFFVIGIKTSTIFGTKLTTGTYLFSNIKITAPLSAKNSKLISEFVANTLRKELVPKEITIKYSLKNTDGSQQYVSSWLALDRRINLFALVDPEEKNLLYLRIWSLYGDESIDKFVGKTFLADVFSKNFLNYFRNLSCQIVNDPELNLDENACSVYLNLKNNDKMIFTLRERLNVPENQMLTIISSCLISKIHLPYYPPIDYCL